MRTRTVCTAYPLLPMLLTLAACTGDLANDTGPSDAGTDTSMVVVDTGAAFSPAPPNIDWLPEGAPPIMDAAAPMLTPCPPGWREFEADGVTACDPWPATGASTCAAHEAHFPGAPGCARIGTTCAADGWPTGLPVSGVIYVREGASGDGSRASPYGRIADAVAGATSSTTIAVAVGRYAEGVTLSVGVTLAGACPETTIITGTVTLAGAGAAVKNITIDGAAPGISARAVASVDDVAITGSGVAGITASSGQLTATNVAIRDTTGGAPGLLVTDGADVTVTRGAVVRAAGGAVVVNGTGSRLTMTDAALTDAGERGLSVGPGASATVNHAAIERNAGGNVYQYGGEVALTDATVRGEGPAPAEPGGQGIVVFAGSFTVSRVFASTNQWAGIEVYDGALAATDLVVIGTVPSETDPRTGSGIRAHGGTLTLERAHLARNAYCSLLLTVETARLDDVVVLDTRETGPFDDRSFWGSGVRIQIAGEAHFSRVRIEDAFGYGLRVSGGGRIQGTDLLISDVQPGSGAGFLGTGLIASGPVQFEAERVRIERVRSAGVLADHGATATFSDVVVRDVASPGGHITNGYGVRIRVDAEVTVSRALLERATLAGVHAVNGGSFSGTDLVIREMHGDEVLGLHGWGIAATTGGWAELTRTLISRTRYVGLFSAGPGASIRGTDITLEDTLEAACSDDICADAPFGIGVGAYSGGAVKLERFVVARSHFIGAQLAGGGTIDLTQGEVSGTPIGVNMQAMDFDIGRLMDRVLYTDNAQNLVADALPVPAVGGF